MALRIEKMISLCKGLGYDEGKAVIVEGGLTGEEVEYEKITEKKGMIEGRVREILTPSPLRVLPLCPYYGICGGCDFQIVGEKDSAYIKEEIVKDTMKRVGKLETLPPFDTPSYSSFSNYRIRCRVHVDLKTKRQGFLAANSNKLIDIDHCPALEEKLNDLVSEKGGILFKRARELMFENRVNRDTGFVEVPLFSGDHEVSMSDKSVVITINGIKYNASASVFFQSNPRLLVSMQDYVKDNAVGDSIMDLYSGVGTFSALFNEDKKTVYAVEREKKCLELSKKNAPSAISFTDDCARWGKKNGKHVDTVIVDPPRTGLDGEVITLLESWKPERIIYISCNPVTASRDISLFSHYAPVKAKVFDCYPGSSHIETIVIMSRVNTPKE